MKIAFLDVDGVLNSILSMLALHEDHQAGYATGQTAPWLDSHIDQVKVKALNLLCQRYNIKLVISSTHRFHVPEGDLTALRRYFDNFGVTGTIIGATPRSSSGHRGTEIKAWLDTHPEVTAYVIIDDGLSYRNCAAVEALFRPAHLEPLFGQAASEYC